MFSDLVTVLIVVSETEPQYAVIPIKQHVNIIFDVFFSTKNLDIWCNKELDQSKGFFSKIREFRAKNLLDRSQKDRYNHA